MQSVTPSSFLCFPQRKNSKNRSTLARKGLQPLGERKDFLWRLMCGHVRETGSHKSQDSGVKERKVQDRDKLESPPEKVPFSFCLPHSCLTLCLISPCQHKAREVSLFINPLLYQEYSSVAQNIFFSGQT